MLSAIADFRPYKPQGRILTTMVEFSCLKSFGLFQMINADAGSFTRSENNFLKTT